MEVKHRFPYKWKISETKFTKDKGTVFSCFSCGGGSSFGYKLAGFDVIGCNEIDPKMMSTYQINHHPKYSYLEPIQTFKLRTDLPDDLYNLDILDGSPPCSTFSMVGSREEAWGKEKKFREGQAEQVLDTLFFDFIDLAKKLQPKVVVAENVKGLLLGEAIQYVRRIYDELDAAGYYVQHWLLDASKMGVPQKRERVFFIALRKDLATPFMKQIDLFTIAPELILEFNESEIVFQEIESLFGENKPLQDRLQPNFEYCIKNKLKDFARYNEDTSGKRTNFNWRLVFNNTVADTITSKPSLIKENATYMNTSELCQIGSYPLDYNFNKNEPHYLIGMSVPPVMIAQIATQIYEQWLKYL